MPRRSLPRVTAALALGLIASFLRARKSDKPAQHPPGDRWDGQIAIEKNTVQITTTRKGPADDSGVRETTTIETTRP